MTYSTASVPSTDPVNPAKGWTPKLFLWLVILVVVVEIDTMQITGPVLALTSILDHYNTSQSAWLTVAPLLAGAIWSPLIGRYADIHGKRKSILLAIVISMVGSLICIVAPNYLILIAGRALQGALITTIFLSVALIRQTFPLRTVALGVGAVANGSGILNVFVPFAIFAAIQQFGFVSTFWIPLFASAVLLVIVRLVIPESDVLAEGKVNVLEGLVLGFGISAILAAVSLGADWGWTSLGIIALFTGGAVLLVLWVLISRRSSNPLIDIQLFANRGVVFTLLVAGLAGGASGITYLLVAYAASTPAAAGLGYGLGANTALFLSAFQLATVLGGLIGGYLGGRRFGMRRNLILSQVILLAGFLVAAAAMQTTVGLLVFVGLSGLGVGATFASVFNLIVVFVKPEIQAIAAGTVTLMVSLIGAAVPVILVAILNGNFQSSVPGLFTKEGMVAGFIGAAILALVGLVAAILVATSRPVEPEAGGADLVTAAD
ncbi:MFS transporter [Subtercola sp. YIM 133946]|uniref:MFS transporter n=1 Tax=Subtercola sp. YIM 133946 TaxID=3118909 RepID=UPI002F930E38